MVIDGTTIWESDLACCWWDDGNRIRLPKSFANPADFGGKDEVTCRLLVVAPGRYRLLTPRQMRASKDLVRIVERGEEVLEAGDVLKDTESNERAAMVASLLPCTVSPPPKMWRINLPEDARQLAPDAHTQFVFLLTVASYIEVWFPDVLRQALSVPVSRRFR